VRAAIVLPTLLLVGASSVASSTVPIEIEHGVLFVRGELNGVSGLRFVLDPGAGDFLTAYGSSRLHRSQAKELRIGTARVPVTMEVAPDEANETAGSIGPSLLKRYALTIDYAASTLTLIPLGSFTPPRNASRLPLSFDEYGMPVVDAVVDERPARFELDVRAPSSMLFAPFLKRSGIAHKVNTVSIAGHNLYAVRFWFATDTSGKFASTTTAGLLGNNVWSNFVLTLDYGHAAAYITAK
jgi:hypothetical protein